MRKPPKSTDPKPEMTKLKELWSKSLSEEERDYWRERFVSDEISQPEIRQELETKYNIKLLHNTQLGRFCAWVREEDARKLEAERAEADRIELEQQGWSGQQLRDELIARMKRRAINSGNFKLGAEAVKLDLAADRIALTDRSVTV